MLYDYSNGFDKFGYNINSLDGEDGIIDELCKRLKIEVGTFVFLGPDENLFYDTFYNRYWQIVFINAPQFYRGYPKASFIGNISGLGAFEKIDIFYINSSENPSDLLKNLEILPKILIIHSNSEEFLIKNFNLITSNKNYKIYVNKQFE